MRYVVLCPPRSGSTLLITAIGLHAGARQGMELFNPYIAGDADHDIWRREALPALFGPAESYLDAAGYLDGERFPLERLALAFFEVFTGAKILWDQVRAHSPVWETLAAMPDLRVIVLRRNPVACAISFKAALDSNVWHIPVGTPVPVGKPLSFEEGYFTWFYDWFCAPEMPIRAKLSERPVIEISYDELITDWAGQMQRARDFLGLVGPMPQMAYARVAEGNMRDRVPDLDRIALEYAEHPVLGPAFAAL